MCVNKDTLSSCDYLIPRWCVFPIPVTYQLLRCLVPEQLPYRFQSPGHGRNRRLTALTEQVLIISAQVL